MVLRSKQSTEEAYKDAKKLSEKMALGVEHYLAHIHKDGDINPWEKNIPWRVQFTPIAARYFTRLYKMTAINPTMEFSGATGISKEDLHKDLPKEYMPKTLFFESLPSLEEMMLQMQQEKIEYPIICKPDVGERSLGVCYIPHQEALKKYIEAHEGEPFHLQEYIQYPREYGLNFRRCAKTGKIDIFSFAEKLIPNVMGDGKKTLRELIQSHKDLSDQQKNLVLGAIHDEELDEVVAEKMNKNIVRTASIRYGVSFENRENKISDKLLQSLMPVIESVPDVYVARFDILADDVEGIEKGEYKIIEMNGVGGMPLHVYEAHLTIPEKYKILNDYFDLLEEVSQINKAEGVGKFAKHREVTSFLRSKFRAQKKTPGDRAKAKKAYLHMMKFIFGQELKKFWSLFS